jgi:hypothetical protein
MIFEHKVTKHYLCSKLEDRHGYPGGRSFAMGVQNLFPAAKSRWGTHQADTLSCGWVEAGEVKFLLAIDIAILGNMTEKTRGGL